MADPAASDGMDLEVENSPPAASSTPGPAAAAAEDDDDEGATSSQPSSSPKGGGPRKSTGGSAKNEKPKTLIECIVVALLAMKDRTGSSVIAISKYINAELVPIKSSKALGSALKKGVQAGTLVKIKASYKLTDSAKKKAIQDAKPQKPKPKKKKTPKPLKKTKQVGNTGGGRWAAHHPRAPSSAACHRKEENGALPPHTHHPPYPLIFCGRRGLTQSICSLLPPPPPSRWCSGPVPGAARDHSKR